MLNAIGLANWSRRFLSEHLPRLGSSDPARGRVEAFARMNAQKPARDSPARAIE
jgi:hypothetical protein